MKKMLFIVGLIVFLSGCTQNLDQEKILSKNELFDKKKECSKLQNDLEEKVKKIGNTYINKLFYSPKQNSCVYYTTTFFSFNDYYAEVYTLQDVFTYESIISESGCNPQVTCEKTLEQAKIDFNNKLQEYE